MTDVNDMTTPIEAPAPDEIGSRVVKAVMWRSGSQIIAQISMWASTFFVIRLLNPSDYGLFAMTQSVLVLLSLLNGGGFAGALVRAETITTRDVRQVFGLLVALNVGIALLQVAAAPLAASYFKQPLVGRLLVVQSLLYLANPLIVLPSALLARSMDFHRQAKVNLLAAAVGALTSIGCALSGFGAWTLVFAPLALVWTRAIGMTIAARLLVWPSFHFGGAGATMRFGGAMLLSAFLWLIQTQADIFIGGRALDPYHLGLYTTSLFLAQILTAKFIPPLNEVAFTAYARLQGKSGEAAWAFEKSVRIIMMVSLPFYFGLATTAAPFVQTMLGPKWIEAVPIVAILALAMPFMTLQILFAPATTALGHTRIQVISSAAGAVIMPLGFLLTVRGGPAGLAWTWLTAFPILAAFTAYIAMPIIGTSATALARAIAPPLLAATGMAIIVELVDHLVTVSSPALRLAMLVGTGGVTYAALALLVARPVLTEIVALFRSERLARA
ncbi:MAG: lipopolysaccharide biosynthesis protein [Sphingomonas sp.]